MNLFGYTLTFDDEFNGFSISRQGTQTAWGDVRAALGSTATVDHYFSDAAFVDPQFGVNPFSVANGALTITASRAPSTYPGPETWVSGLLQTQNAFSQKYGYFEVRAQFAVQKGAWPAFWLLPENGSWPPELDVLEAYGKTTLEQTVHTNDGGFNTSTTHATAQPIMSSGFHTYGVAWTAQTITFYFDGNPVAAQATPSDMHQPMYMLLDLAVQQAENPDAGPKTMQIDYVRAYSAAPNAVAVPLQSISSPDGRDTRPDYSQPSVGSDTLTIRVAGDAWNGNPQFVVQVDGQAIGGIQSVSASHAAGAWQDIVLHGAFGAAPKVSVSFINDAWGGSASADRNLYIDQVTLNGRTLDDRAAVSSAGFVSGTATELNSNGALVFDFASAPIPTPPPPPAESTLVVRVAEDAWNGDAQFTVTVDGQRVGAVQTATASHAAGAWQDITLHGVFGAAPVVAFAFTNDAWGGSASSDRNLYIDQVTLNGRTLDDRAAASSAGFVSGTATELNANGALVFDFANAPVTTPPPPPAESTLVVRVADDAWNGDAQFTVTVDGQRVGAVQTATASHAAGAWQDVALHGVFGAAPVVAVAFTNDAWGGSASADRNLYVDQVTLDGRTLDNLAAVSNAGFTSGSAAELNSNGAIVFDFHAALSSNTS